MNLFEKYHIEKNGIKFDTKKLCCCGHAVELNENVCPYCGLSLKRSDLIFKTSYQKQIRFETDNHFRAYMLYINFAKETVEEKKLWDISLHLTLQDIPECRNDKLSYRRKLCSFQGDNQDKRYIKDCLLQYIDDSDMNIHYIYPDRSMYINEILMDIILYNIDKSFFQYERARSYFFYDSFMEEYNLLKANFDFAKLDFDEEYITYMFGYLNEHKSLEGLNLTFEEQERFMYIYHELYYYINHNKTNLLTCSPKEALALCQIWFDNPMDIKEICSMYSSYLDTNYTLYKIPEQGLTPQFMAYVINNWELVKKLHVSIEEADEYLKKLHDNSLQTLLKIHQLSKARES